MFIEFEYPNTHVEIPRKWSLSLCLNLYTDKELIIPWSACSLFEYLCHSVLYIDLNSGFFFDIIGD
jgi:hypothetical protein